MKKTIMMIVTAAAAALALNVAGNYKANLTWTLTADPTSALEVTPAQQ